MNRLISIGLALDLIGCKKDKSTPFTYDNTTCEYDCMSLNTYIGE